MNTKIKIIVGVAVVVIAGLFFYNKSEGSDLSIDLDLFYVTDTVHRGGILSGDGVETDIGVSTSLLDSLDASVSLFSKKTFDGEDEVRPSIELGTTVLDSVDLGIGVIKYNGHPVLDGDYEVYLEAGLDVLLNPTVSVFHNPDQDLNSIEGQVSHSVEILGQDVSVSAFAGRTELSSIVEADYYGVTASISKEIAKEVDLGAGVTYFDGDRTEGAEGVFFVGINTSF